MDVWYLVTILISLLALGFAGWLFFWVKVEPSSNPEVARIGKLIQDGAKTFLNREYYLLAIFVSLVSSLAASLFIAFSLF